MAVGELNMQRMTRRETLVPDREESWPFYGDDEIDAVAGVLRSGKVNQWTGPDVAIFEKACRDRFGGGPGIALANGSLAIELALRAFDIGPGDEVVVTPRSFVASASCVRLVGAVPVFADVDRESGNLTADSIAAAITERTRAVIPVHLGGWPCDMPAIMALAEARGLKVIEDCAQAHGAEFDGRPVGDFGHAAAFSFCQDKIITTAGEGGYVSFRDQAAWEWAWSFKDHGKNRDKMSRAGDRPGFRWVHDSVGTNWRLTGPQAALGTTQLGKLDDWLAARARNARIWARALAEVPALHVPSPPPAARHAYYRFYAYVASAGDGAERARDEILRRAAESGLRVFAGSCSEIYLESAFDDMVRPDCPNARELGRRSLAMEVHPTLDPEQLERRAGKLAEIARQVLEDFQR